VNKQLERSIDFSKENPEGDINSWNVLKTQVFTVLEKKINENDTMDSVDTTEQPEVEVTAINHRRLGADYYAGRDTEDILSEIERILLGKDNYFYSDDEDLIEKSK
jgi:hypothetical protein